MDSTFYKQLLDELYDGVYFVDRDRCISYWNRGAERISGYSADEMIGRHCWDNLLRHVDGAGQELCTDLCPLAATMVDGTPRAADVFLHHRDGHRVPVRVRVTPIRDATGAIVGAVEVFSDNTHAYDAQHERDQLRELALLDPLTGLGNRRFVESRLQASLEELRRYGWGFSLLIADIDLFKAVNDSFGHSVGDEVIRMVAATLAHNVRAFDSLGRWGGEEFVVIARNIAGEALLALAERLRALVESSFLIADGQRVQVTISIGATDALPDDTPASLLERADRLLYRSKGVGRNQVSYSGVVEGSWRGGVPLIRLYPGGVQ